MTHTAVHMAAHENPSYGDLLRIFEAAENEAEANKTSIIELLEAKFCNEYPHIPVCRPSCFYDTIKRIAAPTKPSAVGPRKLDGSPLQSYLNRRWAPRTRNPGSMLAIVT